MVLLSANIVLVVRRIGVLCWILCLIIGIFLSDDAQAGELAERLADFRQWQKLTSVRSLSGDLVYPSWMAGEWMVKSTLVDLAAPLAPDIVTPGFAANRQYLNQPVSFPVKFVPEQTANLINSDFNFASKLIPRTINPSSSQAAKIIADRAYNGLSLARAYLGEDAVISVKLDPKSPNRQITLLRGDKQLVSIITARGIETTDDGRYITSEVFQQVFRDAKKEANPYFNYVESTTAYRQVSNENLNNLHNIIEADQVTAVYLSPQDKNYFQAGSRPVALYRYKLEFQSQH
ncbi:hypothetical protein NIES4101_57970 [Calothrix sp. NIES-4101]|nr:hypothetical protein NIES4101_57970 [Calothrix sp. NIES-4101]